MIARHILRLISVAALVALAYSAWHRLDTLNQLSGWRDFLVYYALPLGLIALACWLLARAQRVDPAFALTLLASVLLPLWAFELYLGLRLADGDAKIQAAASRFNLPYDGRSPGQVVADLRAAGQADAELAFRVTSRADLMPLGHSPHRDIVYCNEMGQYQIYRSDRHGFNNPDPVWDLAQAEPVFLGDSFTEGACAVANDGFVNRLRPTFPQALNLGMGGNGPLGNLSSLVEYGLPRLAKGGRIIWVHYAGNDPGNLMQERTFPLMRRYLEPGFTQNLLTRADEITSFMNQFAAAEVTPHLTDVPVRPSLGSLLGDPKKLFQVVKLYRLRQVLNLTRDVAAEFDLPLMREVFAEARQRIEAAGGHLIVVNMPPSGRAGLHDTDIERHTAAIWRDLGLCVIDLKPIFAATAVPEQLYSFGADGGHLSPAGNELVTRVLSAALAQSGCPRPPYR